MSKDYVEVIYNEQERPLTTYPQKLTKYLFDRYDMKKGDLLLDLGCGRGEFLKGFYDCGLNVKGIDQSDVAKKLNPDVEIKIANLEEFNLPYDDNTFDFVYSKSVIEHFYYPEKLFKEILRILKPGGKVISLTPDWEVIYKMFYEDYTHRTPFTLTSLKDIHIIQGFDEVKVEKFLQLPMLWSYPVLTPISMLIRFLVPDFFKKYSKFIRFSKEMMLLSSATKKVQ